MRKQWRLKHGELYNTSIDILDLSEEAQIDLARTGITTVGDCLDFYERIPDVMISIAGRTWESLKEIEHKLIATNYLPENWLELNLSRDDESN
jgi:hypothetical protein